MKKITSTNLSHDANYVIFWGPTRVTGSNPTSTKFDSTCIGMAECGFLLL